MTTPPVVSGSQASSAEQNQLIGQCNTATADIAALEGAFDVLEKSVSDLSGQVAAKPDPCNANPQDVALTPAPGTAATVSRCDHVHRGVKKIIAGSNVTINPSSGQGEVTINSTGGGGMTSSRTTYAGDGHADHWVDLGIVPKIAVFVDAAGSGLYVVWYFYGDVGFSSEGYTGEQGGLLSGTEINCGSTNGIANGSWGNFLLNKVGNNIVVYAYA